MKLSNLLVILMLAISFSAYADWKVVEDAPVTGINKVQSAVNQVKVEVVIPDYKQEVVKVDGKSCLALYMPNASMYMKQGFPMLPKLTKLVKIDDRCNVKLVVISKEEVEVALSAPVVPSKGHFTREIPYDSVRLEFGPIYKQDVFWPSETEQITVGEAFVLRDVRGVRVQILPLSVNHVTMKMKVLKKIVFALVCEENTRTLTTFTKAARSGKVFNALYQDSFLNATETVAVERGTVPPENNKKLVVVTPSSYESILGDWLTWKKQNGYTVTVKVVNSGVTASEIKTYLQGLYNNTDTRFGYVVLVGDAAYASNFETAQPMPTFKGSMEGAAADRVYVRLAGNDNYPDAFISRISGNNATDITNQLSKIVAYEKSPAAGDWFTKGTCIASNQGSPIDYERAEWLQNGGGTGQKIPVVAGGLIKYGFTKFDDIYDPSASAAMVTNAVNEGRSLMLYIGHGSSTSWGTTGFSVSNVNSLTNGGKTPVIFSVACVNGDFLKTGVCFAEGWLRKANGGAVAMEAASTNEAWVPPCDKQAATVNAIINKTNFTFGALEAVGCIRGLEAWGDTNSGQGNQMAEQCNLFGDCTLLVRTKAPSVMTAQATRGLDTNVNFAVTSEGRSLAQATVTVYTADFSFMVTGDTDESGNINLSLVDAPAGVALLYTVVGADMVPVVDQPIE